MARDDTITTIRGRTDTWACKLLIYGLAALWIYFGYSVLISRGAGGWLVFMALCGLMYFLPVIRVIQPLPVSDEPMEDETGEFDLPMK